MTSSRKNNEVMEDVDKAVPADHHGPETLGGILIDQPIVKNESIYTRIADNFVRVNDMLNGEKAKEYGDPRTMFQNISKRWFCCGDAEVDVAVMMAELKIERIKYDPEKEDSYLDAIAYLAMALAFMQEGGDAIEETPSGDHEASPWTWNMFAKPAGMTVREPEERFPAEAKTGAMHEPISGKEPSQRLCDK